MNVIARIATAFMALCAIAPAAHAQVSYSLTDVSGNTWQYTYTITNNFSAGSVSEFTIFAPVGDYSNLTVVSSPSSWNSVAIQPDRSIPAAGYFDALAVTTPLATGKSVTGFTERFTWLGKGTPGAQHFNIVNPSTFSTIVSGITVRRAPEIDPNSAIVALTILVGSLAIIGGRSNRRST